MTTINKILSRTNCASNHAATGVYQGDVLSPRYRVRVDPEKDLFCVVDRSWIAYWIDDDCIDSNDWFKAIVEIDRIRLHWPSFDDALAFAMTL